MAILRRKFRLSTCILIFTSFIGAIMVTMFYKSNAIGRANVPNLHQHLRAEESAATREKVKRELWNDIVPSIIHHDKELFANHPYTSPMLLDNRHLCNEGTGKVDIFIYFHSYHDNLARRQYIRNSWLQKPLFNDVVVKYVFVLAKPPNEMQMDNLLDEFNIYQDTIVADFNDDFKNLTRKSLSAMRWIHNYCPQAKYIIKLDDDICLNQALFVQDVLPKIEKNSTNLFCDVRMSGTIVRKNDSHWYVPETILSKEKSFPPHCVGYAVFFHMEMMTKLLTLSSQFPYMNVDDALLFGMVPQKGHIGLIHPGKGRMTYVDTGAGKAKDYITFGARDSKSLDSCWTNTLESLKLNSKHVT